MRHITRHIAITEEMSRWAVGFAKWREGDEDGNIALDNAIFCLNDLWKVARRAPNRGMAELFYAWDGVDARPSHETEMALRQNKEQERLERINQPFWRREWC